MDVQKRKAIVIATLTAASTFILWGPYALDAVFPSYVEESRFIGLLLPYGVFAVFPVALLALLAMRRWRGPLWVSIPVVILHLTYLWFALHWVSLIWFHEWPE